MYRSPAGAAALGFRNRVGKKPLGSGAVWLRLLPEWTLTPQIALPPPLALRS